MIEQLLLLGLLILLSGVFSGSETALFSLTDVRIKSMIDEGVKGAALVEKLKSHPHKLLTVILISNNIVNIGASALATVLAIKHFGTLGPAVATGIMTILVLIFGEITPKSLAINHNEKVSIIVARPLWFLSKVLSPLVWIFENLSKLITKSFGGVEKNQISSKEIEAMATMSAEEGGIGHDEKYMIHGILKLDDKDVYTIMTPQNSIFSLNMNKKVKDVIEEIIKRGYSRIPVYEDKTINLKGVVYAKDMLKVLYENRNPELKEIMRTPFIVPELKRTDDLLDEFKSKRTHLAFVVDEHGNFSGIVTIEDLLEEIVGEIYDETDKHITTLTKVDYKTFIVSGTADIEEVARESGISLKDIETDEFETVNGLIQHKTGCIPKIGEKLKFKHFFVEIIDSNENMVKSVKIINRV